MIKECVLYWIHNKFETDILTQGYVGVTKNLERRIKEHKRKDGFLDEREINIIIYGDRKTCLRIEKHLRPHTNIGLNKSIGGGMPPNAKGIKRNDRTKLLMSQNNVGMKGKKHSEESKIKMKASSKRNGIPHTKETKEKLSLLAKQRIIHPMLGKHHSEKTKKLMSQLALERNSSKLSKK